MYQKPAIQTEAFTLLYPLYNRRMIFGFVLDSTNSVSVQNYSSTPSQ